MRERIYLIDKSRKIFYQLENCYQNDVENFAIWVLKLSNRHYFLSTFPPYEDKKYSFSGVVKKNNGLRAVSYKVSVLWTDAKAKKIKEVWEEDYKKEVEYRKSLDEKLKLFKEKTKGE